MPKSWAQRQIESGVKLELTPYPRRNCWKKFKGKVHYLKHPITKAGYEAALLEWAQIRAKLDSERPYADMWQHHRDLFQFVKTYYEQFGIPQAEAKLAKEVDLFLQMIEDVLAQPELPERITMGWIKGDVSKSPFFKEFVDGDFGCGDWTFGEYELPDKWLERIRQLEERGKPNKQPQTIAYWIEQYESSQVKRTNLRIRSKGNRAFKLGPFKKWIDQNRHVSSIGDDDVKQFHDHLYSAYSSIDSQKTYYGNFKTFLKWMRRQRDCDFKELPLNFDDPELRFVRTEGEGAGKSRLKKRVHLWTPEEFETVLDKVPQPYKTYCVLMLNCGFRQSDLNALRHDDLHLEDGRIIYQRSKTLSVETSPVVNYMLWPKTVELIKEIISDDPDFVFCSRTGKRLIVEEIKDGKPASYDTVSRYWRRARDEFGLTDKRLDYIRKTGSTIIEKFNRDMDTLYLAESLKGVAKINYSFNDGEIIPEFDDAIAHLGAKFGFCDPPNKTITLTPELMEKLAAAGIEV